MNTSSLSPGDRVECNVRGVSFVATISGERDRVSKQFPISHNHPRRIIHRHVSPRQIIKKLEIGGVEG